MTTVAEAQKSIISQAKSFGEETLPLEKALGRVLAQPILADRDYPPFNRSTMDGYAVQAADFLDKKLSQLQLVERIHAGSVGTQEIHSGTCSKIMTGAPVPSGADAVVRVEDTQETGGLVTFNIETVRVGQNIARQGEDAQSGQEILSNRSVITPQVSGILAVTGNAQVTVARLPKIGIISTGNEVVSLGTPVQSHQIRDSNAWVVRGFFHSYQVDEISTTLAKDDKVVLQETVAGFLADKDIIILSGGVSKGDADYVPEILQLLGVQQIFHRVRIRPGGPIWFGTTPDGKAVFGLPGNPVSVQVACKVFIEPYLRTCLGLPLLSPLWLPFSGNRTKKTPFDEFFPCELITGNGQTSVQAVRYNSSGDIAATAKSDGIVLQPAETEQLADNAVVAFYKW
ncbi:molybdopterin molybdotransferase MoeA [Cytophagaceae bacterium YF14B1]|uniref:Molybdopterin molybdenumtransferase n=1 Tax=Xanthocytophaga flava TaxID=3048013 RepID=A0AAE3QRQ9_9BACT|nr:gephyrin-like molybdotransferase Glp [Xanthocytophaga flavus]MDJ1484252.1 molybdopterin molybdotransferase MoeA [Xanthocytophaga flavus]